MALSTYSDLKTVIANYLARADTTSYVADWVTIAHDRLVRDLRGHMRLQKREPAFSITGEYVAVPTDFLEVVSMYLTTSPRRAILALPPDGATTSYPSGSGIPRFYTLVAPTTPGTEMFRFSPVPDTTYTAELQYFASLTAMSAAGDTNWIMTSHPYLYLYSALAEGATHYKDYDAAQAYESRYQDELRKVMTASKRARWGSSGLTMKPY